MLYFDQNAFGKRLQEARRGKQMTQEELADILHVGKLHVSRMERGVAACSLDLLVNISEVLEVNTDKLIKGAEGKNTSESDELLEIADRLTEIARELYRHKGTAENQKSVSETRNSSIWSIP